MIFSITLYFMVLKAALISAQSKTCTPDAMPQLQNAGTCVSTIRFDNLCSQSNSEISISKDCSEFDGSWCCYVLDALENETSDSAAVSASGATSLIPTGKPPILVSDNKSITTVATATSPEIPIIAKQDLCIPNDLRVLSKPGFCVGSEDLEFCGLINLEARRSKDCSETKESWCCYRPITFKKSNTPSFDHLDTTVVPVSANITEVPSTLEKINVTASTVSIVPSSNFTQAGVTRGVVSNATLIRFCTPNTIPHLHKRGICVKTGVLKELCAQSDLDVTQSEDCAEFHGSWCCVDSDALLNEFVAEITTVIPLTTDAVNSTSFSTVATSTKEPLKLSLDVTSPSVNSTTAPLRRVTLFIKGHKRKRGNSSTQEPDRHRNHHNRDEEDDDLNDNYQPYRDGNSEEYERDRKYKSHRNDDEDDSYEDYFDDVEDQHERNHRNRDRYHRSRVITTPYPTTKEYLPPLSHNYYNQNQDGGQVHYGSGYVNMPYSSGQKYVPSIGSIPYQSGYQNPNYNSYVNPHLFPPR